MSTKDTVNQIIGMVILPVTIIIVAIMAIQVANRMMRINAVDQCGHVASVTWIGADKSQVTEPFKTAYEKCIKDKGL